MDGLRRAQFYSDLLVGLAEDREAAIDRALGGFHDQFANRAVDINVGPHVVLLV